MNNVKRTRVDVEITYNRFQYEATLTENVPNHNKLTFGSLVWMIKYILNVQINILKHIEAMNHPELKEDDEVDSVRRTGAVF